MMKSSHKYLKKSKIIYLIIYFISICENPCNQWLKKKKKQDFSATCNTSINRNGL